MECPTYKLLVQHSESAINDRELKKIKSILGDVPEEDYFITITHTPFNEECPYTTSIIILRKSVKEAEPISNRISDLLTKHGIMVNRIESKLLWNESSIYIKIK